MGGSGYRQSGAALITCARVKPVPIAALLRRMHAADRSVWRSVGAAMPAIERAAELLAATLERGGRWISVGAGTSGRLAALDAAELPPTFGTDPRRVIALLAGGPRAMLRSIEGAEDDEAAARRDLRRAHLRGADAVLGIAASGTTPYVRAALAHARARGCATLAIVCVRRTPVERLADVAIVVDTGPEVLAGSTRLKAGTAQKLALNLVSTAVMARLGLVVRGEMVAMRPTNAKLRRRAVRIVRDLSGLSESRANARLVAARWDLPAAVVSACRAIPIAEARNRLRAHGGSVASALGEPALSPPRAARRRRRPLLR